MANEPPCWILDENFKDTGKRDYSRCNTMFCTTSCELIGQRFGCSLPQTKDLIVGEGLALKGLLLRLLKDVDVKKVIRAIAVEHVTQKDGETP
jgi:hypothetical protein